MEKSNYKSLTEKRTEAKIHMLSYEKKGRPMCNAHGFTSQFKISGYKLDVTCANCKAVLDRMN